MFWKVGWKLAGEGGTAGAALGQDLKTLIVWFCWFGCNVFKVDDEKHCISLCFIGISLSVASLLLQCFFLIQFLFKIDASALWSLPPSPVHIPYSILIQNWWKSSMAATSSSSTSPYSKLMEILSGASIHIPYSILIQSWKCSLGQPTYPNTHSLFNSYSKLMKILSGVSFHPNFLRANPQAWANK